MKKNLVLLLLLFLPYTLLSSARLSPETYMFLQQYELAKKFKNIEKLKSAYSLLGDEGSPQVKVFIVFDDKFDDNKLIKLDGEIEVITSKILTARIPVDNIEQISQLPGIIEIAIGEKLSATLDKAIPAIKADAVHNGSELYKAYTGKNVIVGMLDWGFDFTHPMFSDKQGNLRINRAYIGDEIYVDSYRIKSLLTSSTQNNHGSHTLGIAAGNNTNGQYTGVAPEADIIIAELGEKTTTDLIGRIENFLQYADSVQKPIVINLSLSNNGHFHAHDGTNHASVMINDLINRNPEGKIIVASSGNDGDKNMHYLAVLNNVNNSIASSFIPRDEFERSAYAYYPRAYIVGDSNQKFTVEIQIKHSVLSGSGKTLTYSVFENRNIDTVIYHGRNQYNIKMSIFEEDVLSGKPYCVFFVNDNGLDESNDIITFNVTSNDANIHAWTMSGKSGGNMEQLKNPQISDSKYTLNSPADANNVIAVGAYISKESQNSRYEGDIASFNSVGPRTDNLVKPDITAPGSYLVSANNTFYQDGDGNEYISLQGTSMAAPMVTGTIALMLEANPHLTTDEIKAILQETAINDEFTGSIKNNKSNLWGWGKINALAALQKITKIKDSVFIVKTSVDDTSQGSLRWAIKQVNNYNGVAIPKVIFNENLIGGDIIKLATDLPTINRNCAIIGKPQSIISVSANNTLNRIFHISDTANVYLDNLHISAKPIVNIGIEITDRANIIITNTAISGSNKGVYINGDSRATIVNATITENIYGIYLNMNNNSYNTNIINTTIVKNNKYGFYSENGKLNVYNSIVYDNASQDIFSNDTDINIYNSVYSGSNIATNSVFVDSIATKLNLTSYDKSDNIAATVLDILYYKAKSTGFDIGKLSDSAGVRSILMRAGMTLSQADSAIIYDQIGEPRTFIENKYATGSINDYMFIPFLLSPKPISPLDGAINISIIPEFIWNSVPNATSYILEYMTPNLNRIELPDTNHTIMNKFSYNMAYSWRVKASNAEAESDWSQLHKFQTIEDNGIIDNSLMQMLSISPNPVHGDAKLNFTTLRTMDMSIYIYDATGREMLRISGVYEIGEHDIRLNTSRFVSGNYTCCMIENGNSVAAIDFVIVK